MTSALKEARPIYHRVLPNFLERQNVVACGLGYKISHGRPTQDLSLVVSVTRKLPPEHLTAQDLIPQTVEGLPTDVIETGEIRAHGLPNLRGRHRPSQPGFSVGHYQVTAGTFGYLVQRGSTYYILSNNHVLANHNLAYRGDPVYQPGPVDGGTTKDRIATLSDFVPLDFGETKGECSIMDLLLQTLNGLARLSGSRHRVQSVRLTNGHNVMDAALAQVDDPHAVLPAIVRIGVPQSPVAPQLNMPVQKVGRTTGFTQGTISQIDVTVNVKYGVHTARFSDQVMTVRMSNPGDSGSAIVDMDRNAVGLLFAGSEYVTMFTPLRRILDHFGVTLVG